VFPGSSVPNAMVQLTPVTQFHSGSGYQYEDTVIYGFAHTSKGHWNLCNIPLLPATGTIAPDNYILSVPLFDKAEFTLGGKTFTIIKKGSGKTISDVTYDNKKVDDIFISHDELLKGKKLVINTK
jgi:putative alpha-1,2-mannosidase